ncbi:MAG: hypothetical protein HY717_21590 [Planctomycetes bacterium]|nr:hypothetical protein [Planctomycetota bacterium]
MVILILCAGSGSRFASKADQNSLYRLPKPMIPVNGRPILEWTTRSLPLIRHYGEKRPEGEFAIPEERLHFAIRKTDDESHQMSSWLREIYGKKIHIEIFERLTRGNLETAYLACRRIPGSEEILILDSDNAYDGSGLLEAIRRIPSRPAALICHFRRIDGNLKWCFAVLRRDATVKALLEKDPSALEQGGQPMAGTFYFDSVNTFKEAARAVLASGRKTGAEEAQEFYMSQAVQFLIENGVRVYGHQVQNMVPLGTPEDVEVFSESNTGVLV